MLQKEKAQLQASFPIQRHLFSMLKKNAVQKAKMKNLYVVVYLQYVYHCLNLYPLFSRDFSSVLQNQKICFNALSVPVFM